MKWRTFLALCVFSSSMLLAGADNAPMRLDVSGQPEGARVFVDGTLRGALQGSSPCVVLQLSPGRHLLHVESPGFRPFDDYVRLDETANYVVRAVDLEPERGIVLLKTIPAGATVTYGGSAIGTTPLLLTSLACGRKHAIDLSLNGYQSRRIEVSVENRRPIVRREELVLDSGVVACSSTPSGAKVFVDGIEKGVTPVEVMVPRGGAKLTLRLDGYKETSQHVRVPAGERQAISLELESLPASLSIVTEPEQAKVYLDGDYQGKSPATISGVKPGKHEVRVELAGHAPMVRAVELANGGEATERFVMKSVLGRLEVITSPPGARVSIDGRAVGATRAQGGSSRSQILMVEKVAAGEHAVGVHMDGYFDVSRKIAVGAEETKQVFISLKRSFVADTEVETINGAPVRGVLVQKQTTPQQIVVETRPGVFRTIPRNTIRKITPLLK